MAWPHRVAVILQQLDARARRRAAGADQGLKTATSLLQQRIQVVVELGHLRAARPSPHKQRKVVANAAVRLAGWARQNQVTAVIGALHIANTAPAQVQLNGRSPCRLRARHKCCGVGNWHDQRMATLLRAGQRRAKTQQQLPIGRSRHPFYRKAIARLGQHLVG